MMGACGRGIGFGVDDLLLAGGSNSFPDSVTIRSLAVPVCVVVMRARGAVFNFSGTPFCTDKRFCIL